MSIMLTRAQVIEAIAGRLAELGRPVDDALVTAEFIEDFSAARATRKLYRTLEAIRCTLPGEALARVMYGDGGESLREAAARLKVSPGRLSKVIAQYRRLIEETPVRECGHE